MRGKSIRPIPYTHDLIMFPLRLSSGDQITLTKLTIYRVKNGREAI